METMTDLIPLKDACKLLPSGRAGKRVHLATLYRWVLSGKLPAVRRGRNYFVRREDLDALHKPVEVVMREMRRRRVPQPSAATRAETERILREYGLA